MIIYRPHRGSLADALVEAKEFRTEEEMKSYIYEDWKKSHMELGFKSAPFETEDIVIDKENPHEDERIGWRDTMYVCVNRFCNEDYIEKYGCPQCIGMCATDYERKEVEV